MNPLEFYIDPQAVKEALLTNRVLLVQIYGDRHQYRKVSVVPRPTKPIKPGDEKSNKAA